MFFYLCTFIAKICFYLLYTSPNCNEQTNKGQKKSFAANTDSFIGAIGTIQTDFFCEYKNKEGRRNSRYVCKNVQCKISEPNLTLYVHYYLKTGFCQFYGQTFSTHCTTMVFFLSLSIVRSHTKNSPPFRTPQVIKMLKV